LLLILLGGSWRGNFINPGPISTAHSGEKFASMHGTNSQNCAACHKAGDSGPSGLASAAWHAKPGPFALTELAYARRGEMTAIDVSARNVTQATRSISPTWSRACHVPTATRNIAALARSPRRPIRIAASAMQLPM